MKMKDKIDYKFIEKGIPKAIHSIASDLIGIVDNCETKLPSFKIRDLPEYQKALDAINKYENAVRKKIIGVMNDSTLSIIQVYQDIKRTVTFAQIMGSEAFEQRRKESKELNYPLDAIIEGTEVIYNSDLGWRILNRLFFERIVESHPNWRKDESTNMIGEKELPYGISYAFYPKHYQELNEEIQNRLNLIK